MYNSKNLSLSPRKIVKKFIARSGAVVIFLLIYLIIGVLAQDWNYFASARNIIIISIIVLFLILELLYQYLYYKLYYYNFEDEGAEIRKGVVSRAAGHVRYDRLQNIYVDQDILDRMFGLYDVHYETAGEKSGFYSHVDGLIKENADKLVMHLKNQIASGSTNLGL